jgi:hypothetical protein
MEFASFTNTGDSPGSAFRNEEEAGKKKVSGPCQDPLTRSPGRVSAHLAATAPANAPTASIVTGSPQRMDLLVRVIVGFSNKKMT